MCDDQDLLEQALSSPDSWSGTVWQVVVPVSDISGPAPYQRLLDPVDPNETLAHGRLLGPRLRAGLGVRAQPAGHPPRSRCGRGCGAAAARPPCAATGLPPGGPTEPVVQAPMPVGDAPVPVTAHQGPHRPDEAQLCIGWLAHGVGTSGQAGKDVPPEPGQHLDRLDFARQWVQAVQCDLRKIIFPGQEHDLPKVALCHDPMPRPDHDRPGHAPQRLDSKLRGRGSPCDPRLR
jgi:hypothetical protein